MKVSNNLEFKIKSKLFKDIGSHKNLIKNEHDIQSIILKLIIQNLTSQILTKGSVNDFGKYGDVFRCCSSQAITERYLKP